MSQSTFLAERTLDSFRRKRSTPACYPCFKRKVKCRGGRPCEACTERGHPEICHVEELSKGSRRHPKGKVQRSSPAQNITPISVGSEPNVGRLSAVSFVQTNLGASEGKNDAFHVMGMRCLGFPIPLISFGQTGNHSDNYAPLRAEILQFYSPFRDLVMPLYPIVPDPLSLEMWIAELLHDSNTQLDAGRLAVILSSLALGAQFTEAQLDQRWDISQNFIARANIYLQEANHIFEPSTEVVQSLLMIGIALQNLGLSHGAWNLLGLTYRCAQSIGLQLCAFDDEMGYKGAMLWTSVTWQDALMSLKYDRTPLTEDDQEDATHFLPPYYNMINQLCQAGRKLLRQPATWRHNPQNISSRVRDLETIVANAPEHLHPRHIARTLQQKFQYYALRVHSSLLIVEFCRPSYSIPDAEIDNAHKHVRHKGMHHLFSVVESFLELCTFSNVPLRLWSLTQAAISCALVLALLISKQHCPKAQRLLKNLIDVFKSSNVSNSRPEQQSNTAVPEIHGMHEKCATLLESILSRKEDALFSSGSRQPSPMTTTTVQNDAAGTGTASDDDDPFTLTFDDYVNWPTDLSFFDNTFPDSLVQANMDEFPNA